MSVKKTQTGSLVKKALRRQRTEKAEKHCDISCRCNKTEISVQSWAEKISKEIQTEHQRQSCSMNPQALQLDQNQFTQKLTGWKRVFSVSCFTCTFKSNHDEGEYPSLTIFNTYTRDSVDLKTQPALDGILATEIQQCIPAEYKSCAEESKTTKGKTFKPFFSLIVPKLKSKTKSSWPKRCLQLKTCWRPKKPSPFLQEGFGESKECIPVEMIMLANEHADECISLSTCPENELKCPDVLTVSVDVTDITSEMSNEDRKALETSHAREDFNVVGATQGNGCQAVMGKGDLPHIILHSSEDPCIAQNSTVSQDFGYCLPNLDNLHEQQSITAPNITSERIASEYATVSNEIRLHATFNSDSHTIHHMAVAKNAIGPMTNTITAGNVTENVVMKNLDINTSDEHNAKQQCEKKELFLIQVANSVVQVAIKTALKQFEDELLDTAAHLDHQQ